MGPAAPRAHVLVLILDDTQTMLDIMRDLLEDEGYRASTSLQTLDLTRIKQLQPDVIVQDLLIAGNPETGWHFLKLSQRDPEVARIPLILCTADSNVVSEPAMAEHLDRLGIRVLLKPSNLDDLLTMVADPMTVQMLIDQVRDA